MTQDFDQYINERQEPYSAPIALAASGQGKGVTPGEAAEESFVRKL